jgi:glycosyltransferase involved in cell wall biosynthesis
LRVLAAMKVLFISGMYPWPLDNGASLRRYHLLDELTKRHQVTLVTLFPVNPSAPGWGDFPLRERCQRVIELDARKFLPDPADRPNLWVPIGRRLLDLVSSPLPVCIRYWSTAPRLVSAFREIRGADHFDAVWVDRAFFAEVARQAGFERFVVDLDDCQSTVFARELRHSPWYRSKVLHYAELAKLYWYERSLPRRFWRLVVCKEEDRRLVGRNRSKVFVVPNGVPDYPWPPTNPEGPGELFFIGALDYPPNIDAVKFFREAILPQVRRWHPHAAFHLVGRNPDPLVTALHDGDGCVVHGSVRDVTPSYERAAVVVAPIRQGSGTRVKVLEALGRGKALVATSVAAEGLDLRPGVELEIADDPESFARACARLLGDPAARQKLGAAGRRRVLERYRWQAIAKTVEHALAAGQAVSRGENGAP